MPLTDLQVGLLFEIYEAPLPTVDRVTVTQGTGVSLPQYYLSAVPSVQSRLLVAIDRINQNESQVERVGVILSEYEDFSTDPSPIDREGYKFSASRNLRALRKALYPYTGILFDEPQGQIMRLG